MEELLRHIFTTMEPSSSNLIMPAWLDISAILVGAAFGSISAVDHKLDLLGSVALGIMCGLGGGLIRDIILQRGGVYMITSPIAIPLCIAATFAVFFFSGFILKFRKILPWIDILSVVLFAASGTEKAVLYSLSVFAAVMLGTLTGVGGGMLRDMVLGEVPSIFRRGNFYALCAVAGSFTYYVCVHAGMVKEVSCFICVVIGVGLWWLSKRYNWLSPASVDLTPVVARPMRKIIKKTPVVRSVAGAVTDFSKGVSWGFHRELSDDRERPLAEVAAEAATVTPATAAAQTPPEPAPFAAASAGPAPATAPTATAPTAAQTPSGPAAPTTDPSPDGPATEGSETGGSA